MSNLHIWYDNGYLYGENFEENIIYILWNDSSGAGEAYLGNYSEYYEQYFGVTVSNEYNYFYLTPDDTIDIYKLQNTDEAVYSFASDAIESEELVYIGSLTFNNNFEYYATPIISNIGNKTISSLYIHNKEVQSIITSNNVVLYEKENSVIPVVNIQSITLSTDKTILSDYHNEYATLTATVFDDNNNTIRGLSVDLYKNNQLVGVMTDNNDGTYEYQYSATGSGDLSFVADISNEVTSTSVTVKDAIYYASGSDSTKLTDFDIANAWTTKNVAKGTLSVTTDGEWTVFSRSGNTTQYVFIPLSAITGVNVPIKVSMIAKSNDSTGYNGWYNENYHVTMSQDAPFRTIYVHTGSSDGWSSKNNQSQATGIYNHTITYNGTAYSHTLYDLQGNQLKTHSWTMNSALNNANNTVRYGILIADHTTERIYRIKELIVEPL